MKKRGKRGHSGVNSTVAGDDKLYEQLSEHTNNSTGRNWEGTQPLLPASTELAGKTSLYAQRWGERNNGRSYTQYGDKVNNNKFNSDTQ